MNFHRAQTHISDASTHRQLDMIKNSKMFPNSAVNNNINNNMTSNHIELRNEVTINVSVAVRSKQIKLN